mmetsp:Transcript_22184/g.31805  ORF Transcript_22184/g.31805 Transcript_22184/m.31805 type:complete len:133 (-) Transcript_22184:607-1005(-)
MWPSDRKGEASATQRNVEEGETQKKPAPKKVTLKTEVAILGAGTQKRPDNPGSKGSFPPRDTSASVEENRDERPRQVIAVSASKGPAAFFNLARKFLVTDEICDLSALEGAIVAAVDAAHLLERSKLATIMK